MSTNIVPGSVVHYAFTRARRRYVVTVVEIFGREDQLSLVALSGGFAGSSPSSVRRVDLVLDADQRVEFSGAQASYLRNRYQQSVQGAMSASSPNVTRAVAPLL